MKGQPRRRVKWKFNRTRQCWWCDGAGVRWYRGLGPNGSGHHGVCVYCNGTGREEIRDPGHRGDKLR